MQPATSPSARTAFRAALDAAVADAPGRALLAAHAVADQLRLAERDPRARARPLASFFRAAAYSGGEFAPTPQVVALWAAVAGDIRAQSWPLASSAAQALATDLFAALAERAEIAVLSQGAPLLHHPFDAHVPACVADARAAATSLRDLAARLRAYGPALLDLRTAVEANPYIRATTPVGPHSMLLAVVAAARCPQTRVTLAHIAERVGDAVSPLPVRRLVGAARALEDTAATLLVVPLVHAPGAPHVLPDCLVDAEMRAAQLRLFAETPLDARAPPEDDAPRTAAMALLAAAHAARCPVVREYLLNYVATADPAAARSEFEMRYAPGAAPAIARVASMPAPRPPLTDLATRLVAGAHAWLPANRQSPPRAPSPQRRRQQ